MENAFYLVYITVNKITEEKYLGQHCTLNPMDTYLGSGKNLKLAIKKYGEHNFERFYIESCTDIHHLAKRELYWIKQFDAVRRDDWYNKDYYCCPNFIFENGISERTKKKLRAAHKGKTLSESHKSNIRKATKGIIHLGNDWNTNRKFSDEHKSKIGEANKGNLNWKGRTHSEETKRKMSEAAKKRIWTKK